MPILNHNKQKEKSKMGKVVGNCMRQKNKMFL